ncbi:hypothetical protein SARC_08186 [Sphaeroforma arctica JP610]|uniref:uDENN domain-containing protein n=1 Tax=Sphaeroforma arctica JP610 TaxID=667725 RepID=A0A0L0FRV1_9EUKA|nr:hypothetical protein SARC_08186 [Sphaeroforma arctica JP610]KNC79419.1 hypothetical protein SARC_08186 [Sphaeroforma arctica JP610]|eukprot:XP_014153321.1 hypothetical protein SARC_08186 [Sphaeroforma arctica JP610]
MEPDVEATRFLEYFLIGGVDVTHGLTPEDEKICGEDRDDKGDTYSLPPRRHSVISYNSLHMKENGRKSSIKDTPNENKNVLESSSARKQASENGDGGGLDVPKVTKLPPLDLTYNSEGLFRYPVEDYAATPLIPSRVLSFCFPEGVMISKEYKQPKFHSFVITTETGYVYVYDRVHMLVFTCSITDQQLACIPLYTF